ncbi:MAG TPA: hypothetical protein VFM02_00555 [Candidatus Paceibacterota bacterium]|nr:hypothetical protein [Candidatus Paceibacterota bacterium]
MGTEINIVECPTRDELIKIKKLLSQKKMCSPVRLISSLGDVYFVTITECRTKDDSKDLWEVAGTAGPFPVGQVQEQVHPKTERWFEGLFDTTTGRGFIDFGE